jgi:hypothetical protein
MLMLFLCLIGSLLLSRQVHDNNPWLIFGTLLLDYCKKIKIESIHLTVYNNDNQLMGGWAYERKPL